jgi:hypothetical protein
MPVPSSTAGPATIGSAADELRAGALARLLRDVRRRRRRPDARLVYGLTVTVIYTIAGLAIFLGSGSGLLILAAAMGNSMVASIKPAWDLVVQLRAPVHAGG